MQLTYTVVLGSLASLAAASIKREFQFPDSVPLSRRQTSGPEYECHANCGYTILNAEDEGYCDSPEWKELFEGCLACANQYDMWGDYGAGVEAAAEACGLEAVPEGASGGSGGSATGPAAEATATVDATAETSAAPETSVEAPATEETTAAPAPSTASEPVVQSTPSAATPEATPTTIDSDNSASNIGLSSLLAIGAALVAAAGLV
ncbi:hypothetical protein ACJ41O_010833 [Fusarium nematophilum]